MGLFKSSTTQSKHATHTSVIAEGVEFQGVINIEGHLHIDGSVEGDINSNSTVTIGVSGKFKGTLNSNTLLISGHFNGEAYSDSITVKASGIVSGEVFTNGLVIDKGGIFNGKSSELIDKTVTPINKSKDDKVAGSHKKSDKNTKTS